MGLKKKIYNFIQLLFLNLIFLGDVYSYDLGKEEKLLKEECKSVNERSCYKLANFYEQFGYTIIKEKRKIRHLGRGIREALKIYKRQCKELGFEDSNGYRSCQKLEGGSQEIFLGVPYRGRVKRFIDQCRKNILAGCYNLGLIYQKNEKLKKSKKLFIRACPSRNFDFKVGYVRSACSQLKGEQSSWKIFYTSVFLFGVSIFIISISVFKDEGEYQAGEKTEEEGKKVEVEDHGIILRYSRPFFKRYISPIVSSMKGKKKIRDKYRQKLASSGLTNYLTPEDFFSFKLFLIVGFPILFLILRTFLEEDWALTLTPFFSFAGFVYPDMWVNGKIDQRQKEVIMAMPFAVDMMALSVEAGLDFAAAITKVTEKAKKNPFNDELITFLKEVKIGASRAEALRNLSWRIDLIQMSSFCATLIAADSVGASIGPILKNLSNEIRQKKSAQVEKDGATAATKILFPMLFLIVPAVFITVGAPLALQMFMGK
jgi:tight adherence protein C